MRKIARKIHLLADKFPNGFKIIVNSMLEDLTADKKDCWEFELSCIS